MPLLGLIGYPLAHSFSPIYFKQKFNDESLTDWEYQLFPIEHIESLPDVIHVNQDLIAFNVTIPHKTAVLEFCHYMGEEVRAIGAANLVLIHATTKKLYAYNTDYWGFSESLKNWYLGQKKALILGNGGSSKAIQYALSNLSINFEVASRNDGIDYSKIDLSLYSLIVNCTPLGMQKTVTEKNPLYPLPYAQINHTHYFYDLVYNPSLTPMMHEFEKRGAMVKNGLEMLHLQADKAWDIIKTTNQSE